MIILERTPPNFKINLTKVQENEQKDKNVLKYWFNEKQSQKILKYISRNDRPLKNESIGLICLFHKGN